MALIGDTLRAILPGAVVTLEITTLAWLVAVSLGLLVSLGRQAPWRSLSLPLTVAVVLIRSLPQLILLYFVFYGLGQVRIQIDPLPAAVLALGIAEAAYTSEYYRAGFGTVPIGQREAAMSIGLSRFNLLRLVVLPQAVPFLIAPLLNSFVGLMKAATLAAAIGAPELLYQGRNYMSLSGQVGPVAAIIIVLYGLTTIPLTRWIARFEARLRSQYHRGRHA